MHDWQAMGLQRSKETGPLHKIRLEDFQSAVDWMKRSIARNGYMILDVALDADLGMWMFRVQDGVVVKVEHDLVARAQDCLDAINGYIQTQAGQTWRQQ